MDNLGRNHAGDTQGNVQLRRKRSKRSTTERRQIFLDQLAVTAKVTASAEAAGLCRVQVYRLRQTDPDFRAAWAQALREGYEALELVLLQRAMRGVETPVFHAGAEIARPRTFNDAVALRLLTWRRETAAAERAAQSDPHDQTAALTIEEIKAKLAEMRERQAALAADAG